MEIIGTIDEVPAKTMVKKKGEYHEDVMAIIDAVNNADATDKYIVSEFDTDKVANVRAASLRRAGFDAVTRARRIFVLNPGYAE